MRFQGGFTTRNEYERMTSPNMTPPTISKPDRTCLRHLSLERLRKLVLFVDLSDKTL
jgi:hypothetical protein